LRFEIFNEQEGVVFDSNDKGSVYGLPGLYNKKISGSSNNLNTYATELKNVIEKYENRLKDITVSMNYVRKERQVDVNVKGVIVSTGKEYVYTNKLKIWN
jgi:predicted component of type VI protein secretion system